MQQARLRGVASVTQWIRRSNSSDKTLEAVPLSAFALPVMLGDSAAAKFIRFQAFAVATVENDRLLQRIQAALAGNLGRGEGQQSFEEIVNREFDKAGVSRLNPSHLDRVYRTNAAMAYSAGQIAKLDAVKADFPFWEYSAVKDARTRPRHRALDSLVFRTGDYRFFPPMDFNCRCEALPISKAQAEARGIIKPSRLNKEARTLLKSEFAGNKNEKFLNWLQRQPLREEAAQKVKERLIILMATIKPIKTSVPKKLLAEREKLYLKPPENFSSVYFNQDNGGLVLMHQQHNRDTFEKWELPIAKAYADTDGALIEFLQERKMPKGVSTPDVRHDGKEIWDYKAISEEAVTLRTSANNKILDGLRQGVANIAVLIDREKYDIQEINRGFDYGLAFDDEQKIQKLSLVFRGKIQEINRKEWNNGKRFQRF